MPGSLRLALSTRFVTGFNLADVHHDLLTWRPRRRPGRGVPGACDSARDAATAAVLRGSRSLTEYRSPASPASLTRRSDTLTGSLSLSLVGSESLSDFRVRTPSVLEAAGPVPGQKHGSWRAVLAAVLEAGPGPGPKHGSWRAVLAAAGPPRGR